MKKRLPTIVLVLVLVLGLGVMFYPTISDFWNTMMASRAIGSYKDKVAQLSEEEIAELFEKAHEYNTKLAANPQAFYDPSLIGGYDDVLDITGTGIMGYVTIDKIDVELPVYHSVDEAVLQIALGHLPGTSLPVGGASTHSVMSGHRGLPSARLLSDLDQMEEGDIFYITVLNRRFIYQVDQIRIVEPNDTQELLIVPGEDYSTLFTCTPYGINSHRMLVRGTRIAHLPFKMNVQEDASTIDLAVAAPAVGIPALTLILFVFVVRNYIWRKQKEAQIAAMKAMGLIDDEGGRR